MAYSRCSKVNVHSYLFNLRDNLQHFNSVLYRYKRSNIISEIERVRWSEILKEGGAVSG